MDEWTGRYTGKKTDRPRERWTNRKRQAERTGRLADGWTDKHRQMDEWTGRRTDGQTDKQARKLTDQGRDGQTERNRQAGRLREVD